jgi:hypothetical protein
MAQGNRVNEYVRSVSPASVNETRRVGTVKQPHAEPPLESLRRLDNGAARNTQSAGGGAKAAMLSNRQELCGAVKIIPTCHCTGQLN